MCVKFYVCFVFCIRNGCLVRVKIRPSEYVRRQYAVTERTETCVLCVCVSIWASTICMNESKATVRSKSIMLMAMNLELAKFFFFFLCVANSTQGYTHEPKMHKLAPRKT